MQQRPRKPGPRRNTPSRVLLQDPPKHIAKTLPFHTARKSITIFTVFRRIVFGTGCDVRTPALCRALLEVWYAHGWLALYTNNRISVCVCTEYVMSRSIWTPSIQRGNTILVDRLTYGGVIRSLRHCFIVPPVQLFSLLIFLLSFLLPPPALFSPSSLPFGYSRTLLLTRAILNHGEFV